MSKCLSRMVEVVRPSPSLVITETMTKTCIHDEQFTLDQTQPHCDKPAHVSPGKEGIVCGEEEDEDKKECDSPLTPLITVEEDSEEARCKFPGPLCGVCLALSAPHYRAAAPCDAHTRTRTRAHERARTTSRCYLCLPHFPVRGVTLLPRATPDCARIPLALKPARPARTHAMGKQHVQTPHHSRRERLIL